MSMTQKNMFVISSGYGKILDVIDVGTQVFEENTDITPIKPSGDDWKYRGYVPWGDDNLRPYEIMKLLRKDEVLSQNQLFNVLCCYSGGIKVLDQATNKPIPKTGPVFNFFRHNRPARYFMEQINDFKHFFFCVSVLILSNDGKRIVQLRHKEACYCRFETCDPKTGKIEHIFFGNWEKNISKDEIEVLPLLDPTDPIGDLEIRTGRASDEKGVKKDSGLRKFAILTTFPCVGNKYYPFVPFWAIFNSGWFDIKQMIPIGKKAKFQNSLAVRWLVEINPKYRAMIMDEEKITDPKKQIERWNKEKENIREFMMGIENEGKVWITGYYVDPKGVEQSYVKITCIDKSKQGGDWIEDSEEASNMLCYGQGIHPSLIGATPGKTKGSFSGSDKRELFTMKQSMEIPFHDLLLDQFFIIQEFNKATDPEWDKVVFDIPIIMLTTLDQGKDAKATSSNELKNGEDNNDDTE